MLGSSSDSGGGVSAATTRVYLLHALNSKLSPLITSGVNNVSINCLA